ncbi:MAG: hypothetical protein R2815_03685 [Flavobacteriales bacterium]
MREAGYLATDHDPTMRLSFRTFLAATAITLFTGCLTIEENYTFKKNGSGTMEYVIDLSEMGELMKSIEGLGDSKDKSSMGDLGTMDMEEQVEALKKIPGIKKVKLNNKKEWVQRLSFAFNDLDALNAALNTLLPDSTGARHTFFAWEGNTLVRTNNRHAYELGAGMAGAGEEEATEGEEESLDMSSMLETMKYKYSFKFADGVGNTTVAEGVKLETVGAKEVKMDTDFGVISKDPLALDLRIPLNK